MEAITKEKNIKNSKKNTNPKKEKPLEQTIIQQPKEPDLSVFEDKENQYVEGDLMREACESIKVPTPGMVHEGVYIGQDDVHFLLDCGFKDLVRVPKNRDESSFLSQIEIGTIVKVIILQIVDEKEYYIKGSVSYIYKEEAFQMLSEMEDDYYVRVQVDELTLAGYNCTLKINGCEIDAFLPQILAGVNKIHDDEKEDLVGKDLEMCVESYSSDKGTWIVSRRKYLKQLIPAFIQNLETDVDYTGSVTGTAKYGVFVEFNECLTGMIHRSNLKEDLRNNFESIKPGDDITFNVKEIIKGNRIILTQVEKSSLWDTISIGQKLEGTIKEHKPFGSLVILDHETLGLIHTSELSDEIKEMESGDKINVKVLAVDRPNRKIFLKSI